MTDAIDEYLGYYGPCLTTDLSAHLETTLSIKPAAARQKVSRAKDIKRLAYFPFPRNARFVYLQKDFGSDRFWRSLTKALTDTNSAYGSALAAIRARGGLIPKAHFPIACGAPIQQKKHLSPDIILQRLVQAELVEIQQFDGLGECVTLRQDPAYLAGPAESSRARLFAEEILLAAISTWVRNLGIVSYGKVATRDIVPLPMVGRTAWDLTAPSYLGFLRPAPSPRTAKPEVKASPVSLRLTSCWARGSMSMASSHSSESARPCAACRGSAHACRCSSPTVTPRTPVPCSNSMESSRQPRAPCLATRWPKGCARPSISSVVLPQRRVSTPMNSIASCASSAASREPQTRSAAPCSSSWPRRSPAGGSARTST